MNPASRLELFDHIRDPVRRAKDGSINNNGERTPIFIHYAGHGSRDVNQKFDFQGPCATVQFKSSILDDVLGAPFDVVLIIDSWYSGASTRDLAQPLHGVVEILAAAGADETAFKNHASNHPPAADALTPAQKARVAELETDLASFKADQKALRKKKADAKKEADSAAAALEAAKSAFEWADAVFKDSSFRRENKAIT